MIVLTVGLECMIRRLAKKEYMIRRANCQDFMNDIDQVGAEVMEKLRSVHVR